MRFNSVFLVVVVACGLLIQTSLAEGEARAPNWFENSHAKRSNPSYDVVFPTNRVNTLTIRISPDNWQAMQDNMVQLYGEVPNESANSSNVTATDNTNNSEDTTTSASLPTSSALNVYAQSLTLNNLDNLNDLVDTMNGITANPIWIQADLSFNGKTWENVGLRYKGNSSLSRSWLAGAKNMPFKFDFDEFEDDFPEIKNQRFYGFKQLLLNNNIGDASYLRDAASYKVMNDMGLAAPKTAWYEIYLDRGQGLEELGIYTMIEVLDDTVIKAFYGSDKGNIYEADGVGASLSRDTVAELMQSFQKENNKSSDYSDLAKLFQVLHSGYRVSEAERWQAELEAVFDVDDFLKWLATNTVIQNWDTYGAMAHNFYLYKVPETEQFSWIGWDYNESMGARAYGSTSSDPQFATNSIQDSSTTTTRGLAATTTSLDHSTVTDGWPLIRFLMDDPLYFENYKAYVEEVIETAYNPENMSQSYTIWSNMLRPYTTDVVGFDAEVERLRGHGEARAEAVYGFLSDEVMTEVVESNQ